MKKALAVMMMCAFAVSAMAQWLIYDYKVSFKRVDAVYTKVSYSFNQYDGKNKDYTGYFDSFKSDSDTLTGIIIIPACTKCNGDWANFGNAAYSPAKEEEYDAFKVAGKAIVGRQTATQIDDVIVYVTRGDDKLYTNPYGAPTTSKLVWKFNAWADAAMFNKGVAARLMNDGECFTGVDSLQGKPTSIKNLKEAWMVLSYDVPAYIVKNSSNYKLYPPVKGLPIVTASADTCEVTETVSYGFLGYQCKEGSISHSGFGKVTTATTGKDSTTVAFCGSGSTVSSTCTAIQKISGSVTGEFFYDGFCGLPPMFDICELTAVDNAPISGTWSFTLNTSASKKNGGSLASAESYAEAKLLKGADNLYDWTPSYSKGWYKVF